MDCPRPGAIAEVWWAAFQHRLQRSRSSFPRDLKGQIQFSIQLSDGARAHYAVRLCGPESFPFEGDAPPGISTTFAAVTERDLARRLDRRPSPGDWRLAGDLRPFLDLLAALAEEPEPRSLLALRVDR